MYPLSPILHTSRIPTLFDSFPEPDCDDHELELRSGVWVGSVAAKSTARVEPFPLVVDHGQLRVAGKYICQDTLPLIEQGGIPNTEQFV
jgi:hypothetical protein